jgi:hypothetical protein
VNNKGQFSIIAALLVAVVLIAAVMTTYSAIRYNPLQEQPQVLSAIDEINLALKQILGFTVGYYGSVLKVTGNSSYARMLATNYLSSGLNNIADLRPEWGPTFNVTDLVLKTKWFTETSYSVGNVTVKYDLNGIGVYGVSYSASSRLDVTVSESNSTSQASLTVLKDADEPLVNLASHNFDFYRYDYENSTWKLINPTNITSYADGTYSIDLPSGVPGDSYVLQVEDSRGIIVTASSFSRYTATIQWDDNYTTIPNENIVVETLQNGTMRWLGQKLNLTTGAKPIPPIPVKSIHVTQTIDDVDQAVPFQIEDWASEYRNPLGMASNTSIFSSRNMIVFLANSHVSKFTIWWNGSDDAVQTPPAYQNIYFKDDTSGGGRLDNGQLVLTLPFNGDGNYDVTSTVGGVTSRATLMRVNTNKYPTYGSNLAYIIYNGVVRDIIHQEAEWSGGISGCPNVYSQIVITLPAGVTYYTYQLRLMFLDSEQSRTVSDFCPIRITTTSYISQLQTENGTTNGYPDVATGSSSYYNFSDGTWEHHWSQFTWSSGTRGAGMMFTDSANQMLYRFDTIAGDTTGALKSDYGAKSIEVRPVNPSDPATFQYALDVMWHGAVATFDNTTPIYASDQSGLWMLVEYPPIITVTAET